ncbi:MAG: MATE family efflux transporter [Panacagrimonas sp.]
MRPSLAQFRQEARANLRLAAPLIAAQLSFVSMGTVDTIFAGRLGASELAAVAVGSNAWFLLFVPFMGIGMAVSPIVAQRLGGGQTPAEVGSFLRGTITLALALGLLWLALMAVATHPVVELLHLDAPTAAMTRDYLRALAWAAPPFSLCFFLRNGAEGHGLTRAPLLAGIVGLAVNAGCAWVLMYGRWGFAPLGPEGAGWATVIAAWAMVLTYLAYYRRVSELRALQIFRFGWTLPGRDAREVLRVGLPIAAIFMAEVWLFCAGTLLMARFGAQAVAAHQIAINFASLCFMVPTAIGMATTVRVGHAAGAGHADAVALRGRTGMALGIGFAAMSGALMGLAPGVIVTLYTDVQSLAEPAVRFLQYAAIFQVFDCIQATSNGALRGIKDTRHPMVVTFIAYWIIGMPLAGALAFWGGQGPDGIWYGFIAALVVAAAGLSLRFLHKAPHALAA